MKVLITGGAGFLGSRLATELLKRGHLNGTPITQLILADRLAPSGILLQDRHVQAKVGDLIQQCEDLGSSGFDVIFHLAAATSAECEADFDLGMRSNVDTTRALLDSFRIAGTSPRFVFASSVAVFGSEPDLPMPSPIRDETLPMPQSSYGIQKFICEQLVADYTRRGFIDGRNVRLMTVTVRPGKPNGAASSFLSSVIREPLHGESAVCPVSHETAVAVASPERTIEGIIAVAEADRALLGGRTSLNLPALTVRISDMLHALETIGGTEALQLIHFEPNATIERIVGGWPSVFDSNRARRLGLRADRDFKSIVEQFIQDDTTAASHLAERADR